MKYRKMMYSGVIIGLVAVAVCSIVIYHIVQFNEVKIAFLDIGQGDATLISKGSQQILIDGGPDGIVLLEQLGKHVPFWDRNIEIVIATHPDGDHVDGLISVFENYSVNQFWHTRAGKDTSIYRALVQRANSEERLTDVVAYSGLDAVIGAGTKLSVIYPFVSDVSDIDDVNNASIVTIFYVGNEIFYLGGDVSSEIEDNLRVNDEITVAKASHHGSKSSTSEIFLDKVRPRDVVISVGKENRYGHPHSDVVERILSKGINIFRTDSQGTIIYKCNSKDCSVILEK